MATQTKRRHERGAALFVAVLMLSLMGIIGLASMDTVMRDRQVAGFQSRARTALYAAEAGISWGQGIIFAQVPGEDIANLVGGSAPPEYRGKGAYRALLARRFKDAAADGAQAMVVQCDRTTSSPICQRIGMKKLCDLDIYMFETPDAPHRGEPRG